MRFEKSEFEEQRALARFLCNLSEHEFVLHGSPHRLTTIEPRLARGAKNSPHQNLFAVYASIAVEYALIHALIPEPNYHIDRDNELLVVFGDEITVRSGYIYVLPAVDFEPLDDGAGGIWRIAKKPVTALAVIEAHPALLPHFPLVGFQCDTLTKKPA